jgi:hypothetical protein
MAFKMKGPNFGKGTGSENPMKVNSSFKKESRLGRFVKGVKEVGSAIKETFATGSTPAQNRSRARAKRGEEMLIKQKIRQGKFDESKLNSFQKTVYNEMQAREKGKQKRAQMEKDKANIEKNVAENKAAGPKTQAQKKDEKRPPMAMKKKKKSPMKSDEMAKAVAAAKKAQKKAKEDPNELMGIDPKKFSEMLRSTEKAPTKMIKKKDATKDHNRAARKTEGTRLRQSLRRAVNKVKAKSPNKMKKEDSAMKLNKGFDKLPKEVQAKIIKKKK